MDQVSPPKSRTLTREEWLELAVDCLRESGAMRFRLDDLIRAMPVTKGSFYHHFSGKPDFQRALVEFWDRHYTEIIVRLLDALPKDTSPEDRFLIPPVGMRFWRLATGRAASCLIGRLRRGRRVAGFPVAIARIATIGDSRQHHQNQYLLQY